MFKASLIRLLVWTALVSVPVVAQYGQIRGVVSDARTGEKLPFATVRIEESYLGTSTNATGFYLLANISPGEYEISASTLSYKKQSKKVNLQSGENLQINFELEVEALEVPEVVVTERRNRQLSEIQTSIQVMDQQEMKAVPATVQEDVFRSLQILPGIVSTSDVSSQFYVRGGAGDQNLILLDGMRIYSPYHALGIFSIFDPDIVQATEVYTGAFPAGLGGRLSSVVNLVSRDGRKSGTAGTAELNFMSAKASMEGGLTSNVRGLVSARSSHSGGRFGPFLRDNSAPLSFYDVFAKATLEQHGGITRYNIVSFLSGDNLAFADPAIPDQRWRSASLGATASGLLQEKLYVSGQAYSSSFHSERRPKESGQFPSSSSVSDVTISANALWYGESQTNYYFGFDFNFPSFTYDLVNSVDAHVVLRHTIVDGSMWFRYRRSTWLWSLDAGLHVDATELFRKASGYIVQPRIHASLGLFDDWKLKGSFGRISQHAITVNNEDDVISLFDAWIAIPKGLNSQHADHYVLGFGGTMASSLGIDIQTYFKDFTSLVVYNRDKVTEEDSDYILGSGSAYGVEVAIRVDIPRAELITSYSLGKSSVTNGSIAYPPRYDRRHSVKSLLAYHLTSYIDLSARWEFGSGLPTSPSLAQYLRPTFFNLPRNPEEFEPGEAYIALGPKNSIRLPAFHRLDISATLRTNIGPILCSVSASIINLYDRKNIFYVDRHTGQSVTSLPFFPSASLTLEYK